MRVGRLTASLAVAALSIAACGSSNDSTDGAALPSDSAPDSTAENLEGLPDGPAIVIGSQDFGESAVLAQVYGQALAADGFAVDYQAVGGYRDVMFNALDSGDVNFTLEYAASALEFLNGQAGQATSDIDETMELLSAQLEAKGLVAGEPSDAVDSNAFVVTQETADETMFGLVSDLTEDMRLGGPPDCPENASCLPGLLRVYGIDLSKNFVPLDGGGPLTVAALEGGEIDVAVLFSTDGVIAEKGWVVLEDDEGLINADNVVPVFTSELNDAYGVELTDLVDQISLALDTEELTELNRQYGLEKRDAADVAHDWLDQYGFL